MGKRFRAVAYWTVFLIAIVGVIFNGLVVLELATTEVYLKSNSDWRFKKILPFATLLLTAITTFSGVIFGWRADRRQAKELDLKVKELEARLAQIDRQLTP